MNILEGPCHTILDSSPLDKAVLVFVNDLCDDFLQPISKKVGYKFETSVKQGDRPLVIDCFRRAHFWNKSDQTVIDAGEIEFAIMELVA